MTIGTALVVVAILYFIDKHNLWKRAAVVCLIVLALSLLGLAGYDGWQKWRERKAAAKAEESQKKADAALESQWQVVDEEPDWNIPPPPKGFISEGVSYAILHPINADQKAKTDAWKRYRASICVIVGDHAHIPTHVLYKNDIFSLDSGDPRWMSDIALPENVKRALWNAKTAECRLPADVKNVKACLNRETGAIDVGVEPEKWAQYLTNCGPKMDMIYLSGAK